MKKNIIVLFKAPCFCGELSLKRKTPAIEFIMMQNHIGLVGSLVTDAVLFKDINAPFVYQVWGDFSHFLLSKDWKNFAFQKGRAKSLNRTSLVCSSKSVPSLYFLRT